MIEPTYIRDLLEDANLNSAMLTIAKKVLSKERISEDEGLELFQNADLSLLAMLANYVREDRFGDKTFFNRNFHIEPTNICVFDCKFCSYSRLLREKDDSDAWELNEEEIYELVRKYDGVPVTEVHIVGGVHPKMGIEYFANIIKNIKKIRPDIHVKAFTAVELEYMCRKAKMSYKDGLIYLKEHGQDSLPGGGAEIFDEEKASILSENNIHSTILRWPVTFPAQKIKGRMFSGLGVVDIKGLLNSYSFYTDGEVGE
ncbi:MAG: hypothetical protein IH948_09315, partial [Bacteroidetes bacterium]|nr:hypothetical protein [Bacteroidota bacterium]